MVATLLKLVTTACVLASADLLVFTLCHSLQEANTSVFCVFRVKWAMTEHILAFFSLVDSLTRLTVVRLHRRVLQLPRGWCAGEALTAKRKDRMTAITRAIVKAKRVESQLRLLVINTTSPAASKPLFDPFHSPQRDYALHFETHCCSTAILRGEVYWQYTAVNLDLVTSYPGLVAACCSWCTEVNVTR